jgi:hypothetical protein
VPVRSRRLQQFAERIETARTTGIAADVIRLIPEIGPAWGVGAQAAGRLQVA